MANLGHRSARYWSAEGPIDALSLVPSVPGSLVVLAHSASPWSLQPSGLTLALKEMARCQHEQFVERTAENFAKVARVTGEQHVGPSQCAEENWTVLAGGKNHGRSR